MHWKNYLIPSLAAWSIACLSSAHDWRSADGKREIKADFVALAQGKLTLKSPDGKPIAVDLTLLSPEDQALARAAQQSAEEAAKLVPITFEVQHVLDEGWLCLAGKQAEPKQGPWVFSGEPFLWLTPDAKSGRQGDRIQNQRIFPAGLRTFHPKEGGPMLMRAYAATAELAAADVRAIQSASRGDVTMQAPPVHEPVVEFSVSRGLGLSVGKAGLVVVDAALLKDADSIVIHANKNQFPAKVEKTSEKQGFALLSCATTLEPGRFAARKEMDLGQPVFAVSFMLGSTKKAFTQPTVTKGIVSRLAGKGGAEFQHDAIIASESVGGYIVGEKGDVLGIYFGPGNTSAPKESPSDDRSVNLNAASSTEALSVFLESIPNLNASRVASSTPDVERCVENLRATSVLVTVTRKVIHKIGGGADGVFSLSSSGVRHNAQCRYFRADKPCGPNEGKPCGICKG